MVDFRAKRAKELRGATVDRRELVRGDVAEARGVPELEELVGWKAAGAVQLGNVEKIESCLR